MSRKNLVKKLIAIVGSDEDNKATVVESFLPHVKKTLTFKKHVLDLLEESTGRKNTGEYSSDFVVGSQHVRRFFNKLQLGVHAVQNYLGKVLKTPEETVDYFLNTIGNHAYGADWLLKETIKLFENEDEGLYLITDLTLNDAKRLKTMLGNSLALTLVEEATHEKFDFLINPKSSKAAIKRVTAQTIEKLTQTETRRNANERTTTEPELQS